MAPISFVTGAGGCVGRALVARLLDQGRQVTALLMGAEADTFPFHDHPAVRCVQGDLMDFSADGIPLDSDIFHLAAQAHWVPRSPQQTELFFRINRDGSARLAELARQRHARSFLLVSTIAVYGPQLDRQVCSEATPPEPDTPYGLSKWQAEQEVRRVLGGVVPLVIVRPAVMFGPGDRGNFSRLIRAVLRGRLPVVDGGRARKSTLYVGNFARIAAWLSGQAGRLDGTVLNVADLQPMSILQIAQIVAQVAGKRLRLLNLPSWLLRLPARAGDMLEWLTGKSMPLTSQRLRALTCDSYVDTSRLQAELGLQMDLLSLEKAMREHLAASEGQAPPPA